MSAPSGPAWKVECPSCAQHIGAWPDDVVRVRCGGCDTIVWESSKALKKREREDAKTLEAEEVQAVVKDLERAQAHRRRERERRVMAKLAPKLAS